MKCFFSLLIFWAGVLSLKAQQSDTLQLTLVVQRVLASYPTTEQAWEVLKSTRVKVEQARSVFLPQVSGSASYLWTAPVSTMKFDGHEVDLDMKNSYQAGLSFSQVLYDFGKNRPKIESARLQEELARLQLDRLYQALALQTIQAYYLTGYARKAIQIKQDELSDILRLLNETKVKKASGAVTDFDVLNTQVKYSSTESELATLRANKYTQNVNLSLLADTLIDDRVVLEEVKISPFPPESLDELISTGLENRPEIKEARKRYEIAFQEEKISSRVTNPSLDLKATAGGKNGFHPHLDRLKLNYSVGATLSIPIYEGGNRKREKALSHSRLVQEEAAIRLMEIEIKNQITTFYHTLKASLSRMELARLQIQVAREAFLQAETNYIAGAITNLELLTSATNLSAIQLQFEQEKMNYQVTYYQLMQAIGRNIQEYSLY